MKKTGRPTKGDSPLTESMRIRLEKETFEALTLYAQNVGKGRAEVVREMIKKIIKENEMNTTFITDESVREYIEQGKNFMEVYCVNYEYGDDSTVEYYTDLEEAKRKADAEKDNSYYDKVYIYKTALGIDEFDEVTQDGAIQNGWNGDYYGGCTPVHEIK